MANDVFANGREISCKKADGKSICAFPDVCFTPPENPATPPGVPVPYPNTGLAKDMTSGSKSVKITGQEVMLKNKSYFKKSYGDEAGCAAKKGIVTSVNRGKVYFISWSMDVKFEGENVVRHLDMTTHNHASPTTNTAPWNYFDSMESASKKCKKESKKTQDCMEKHIKKHAHKGKQKEFEKNGEVEWGKLTKEYKDQKWYYKSRARKSFCEDDECRGQMDCNVMPFDFGCCNSNENDPSKKPPDKTPHHIVPSADFIERAKRGKTDPVTGYNDTKAPCLCLQGNDHNDRDYPIAILKEHGRIGRALGIIRRYNLEKGVKNTLNNACIMGAMAVKAVKKHCDEKCLAEQLKSAHSQMKLKKPGPDDEMPRDNQPIIPELIKPKI
jgi:hypothetical protein